MDFIEQLDKILREMVIREHLSKCRANRDGDCDWHFCPQLRDGEPDKTGRYCPLEMFWDKTLQDD